MDSRPLTLLDLPEAVLGDILSHCEPGSTRAGICLPLVCKAFRALLLDLRDVRLWGTVAPLSCVSQHSSTILSKHGDGWPSLQRWLQQRGAAIHTLDIAHPSSWRWCDNLASNLCCLQSLPNLTALVIDLPGPVTMTKELRALLASLSGLRSLRLSLRMDWDCNWRCNSRCQWLQNLQRLTSIQLDNSGSAGAVLRCRVLRYLTMLEQITIGMDHDAYVAALADLPALQSLTLKSPYFYGHIARETKRLKSVSGLTALSELMFLEPHNGYSGHCRSLPSDAALRHLTNLVRLQLHVSGWGRADGSMQPSITKLRRLAQLWVVSPQSAPMNGFPPGFGGLSALTSLRLCKVAFGPGMPLQGGLEALRVLEVGGCSGPLGIACALPALQRMGLAHIENLELLPAFLAALDSQPHTRCEYAQAWPEDDHAYARLPDALPSVMFHLPRLHSVAMDLRGTAYRGWRCPANLLPTMSLDSLEELDLQCCKLGELPAQLGAASRLQRLRIVDDINDIQFRQQDLGTFLSMGNLTFLSVTQLDPPAAYYTPKGPFDWGIRQLNILCCLLRKLRARNLTVVLREPSNVAVPLAVAAAFPADALGRCALTTTAVAARFGDDTPEPCEYDWGGAAREQWIWLEDLLPQRNAQDAAEVDGAAAMSAAVSGLIADWVQLQADALAYEWEQY